MRAIVALAILLGCSSESAKPSAPPKELAACEAGDGPACFIAATRYKNDNGPELDKSIELWTRGCELGHGVSCAQLGTVVEFGLGGRKSNPTVALSFYRRACNGGDKDSCKRVGEPSAEERPKYPWREALTPICGKQRATLGELFDGLELGKPMPPAVSQRIEAWQKLFKGRVHYYPGDVSSQPHLEVRFDEPSGLGAVLTAGWGKPDRSFGAWNNAEAHLRASLMQDGRTSAIFWSTYRSVDELIRPADPERFGFEPLAAVGAKLADLEAALGQRLLRRSEDDYVWSEYGVGANFEPRVTQRRGLIVRMEVDMITNGRQVGDEILTALATKLGTPKIKAGVHTWQLEGRRITASKPATGNLAIVIEKL